MCQKSTPSPLYLLNDSDLLHHFPEISRVSSFCCYLLLLSATQTYQISSSTTSSQISGFISDCFAPFSTATEGGNTCVFDFISSAYTWSDPSYAFDFVNTANPVNAAKTISVVLQRKPCFYLGPLARTSDHGLLYGRWHLHLTTVSVSLHVVSDRWRRLCGDHCEYWQYQAYILLQRGARRHRIGSRVDHRRWSRRAFRCV